MQDYVGSFSILYRVTKHISQLRKQISQLLKQIFTAAKKSFQVAQTMWVRIPNML